VRGRGSLGFSEAAWYARTLRQRGILIMVNGNRKGKAGERELCAVLRAAGFEARRSQQYCGVAGDEDITHTIPGVHVECKRVERLNVAAAYDQARRDAHPCKVPLVAHRCNRTPWLVTLSLSDFLALMKVDDAIE
jgi:Holliday junction resolvase